MAAAETQRPGAEMGDHSNLYVSGLPDGMDDGTFRQLFEKFGNVISSKVVPEKRYGFVKFSNTEEANAAVGNMNGDMYNGCQLSVRFANNDRGQGQGGKGKGGVGFEQQYGGGAPAGPEHYGGGAYSGGAVSSGVGGEPQPSDNLYITGMPPGMTDQMIHGIFGAYGQIISTRVLNPNGVSQDGQGMTIALMRMGSLEQAVWLVDNLNGNIPQGLATPIGVRYADPPGAKAQRVGGNGSMKGGDPARYGQPYIPWDSGGGGKGGDFTSGGIKGRQHFTGGGDDTNLYVKGLPTDGNDLYLYKLFAPFGGINSVRAIMQEGQCTGIGFVKFVESNGAQQAVSNLNGCPMPNGNVIYVSVKTQKRDKDL